MRLMIVVFVLVLSGCQSPAPYQLVSQQYNFSVQLPEPPTQTITGTNDEGLPSNEWVVKHSHLTETDYYDVRATCYNEILNPDTEFTGADDDPALALNGVKQIVPSRRYTMKAKETGREIPAISRTAQSQGAALNSIYAINGRCMISVGTRVNPSTVGESALFLESFEFLK